MKARKLKSILFDTSYIVHCTKNKVCVGTPLVHDLINIDMKTMNVQYKLGGEPNGELMEIRNKLKELIDSGDIYSIIEGNDELSQSYPVWSVRYGKLYKDYTDEFGFPNVTASGELMYNNTHFPSKELALKEGLSELRFAKKHVSERINDLKIELEKKESYLQETNDNIKKFEKQLNSI